MRTFLFATKVLLVDGPTDWEVVRCIFTKHNILQNDANVKNTSQKKKMGGEVNKKDDFQIDRTTF